MNSGDCHLNVEAIKNPTGPTVPVPQEKVTPDIQASSDDDDRVWPITDFFDVYERTDRDLLVNLKRQNDEEHAKNQKQTKIQRVPEVLQRNEAFKDYFKPIELSVGFLHHTYLFKAELKLKLAARFIKDSGYPAGSLLTEFKTKLRDPRTFFEDLHFQDLRIYGETDFDDVDNLKRVLFLDGCAILQFIISYMNRSLNEFNINNGQADLIRQDLFLFENQIPFQVLELLMDMKEEKETRTVKEQCYMKDHLVQFILANSLMDLGDTMPSSRGEYLLELIDRSKGKTAHLLGFLRTTLIMNPRDNHKNFLEKFFDCLWYCLPHWLFKVLDTFATYRLSFFEYNWNQQQSFRNVQELKAAGIKMKPSGSRSLKDICFHSGWFFRAHVELPPLLVDSSTARKMMNLVAYEMCHPDYENDCYVTSYINLLDLLIDDEEDVKDLRSADVLRNRLSSDREVAQLFNRIGSACFPPPKDTYQKVKTDIEKHYKRKLAVWMAQVYHAHFSSPWTILALIGAVVVLLLTAIQTWFTINPKN